MFDKEQKQKQYQSLDIAYEKHGILSDGHCPYYTDKRAEFFESQKDYGEGTIAVKNRELFFKSKVVKYVVYEGKVSKVICPHIDASSKNCHSPLRKVEEGKKCHIID